MAEITKVMGYMDLLYGIDNPLFLDLKDDPADEYLATFTKNPALVDMFTQHFFKKTPSSFALSYFSLYMDYRCGTGSLPARLEPEARLAFDTRGCFP